MAPMSLTSHLADPRDPIRAWIDTRLPNIGALVADSRRSLRDASTVCAVEGRPPTTSGIAIDYRIRYAFAETPPVELVAYAGAADVLSNLLMEIDPAHEALWRTVDGTGLRVQQAVDPATPGLPPNAVSGFFAQLVDRILAIAPAQGPPDAAAERELARHCFGLGLFEEVWRTGNVAPGSLLHTIGPATSTAQILARIPDDWVEDLAQLAKLFLTVFGDRLGRPAVLNPVFAQSTSVGGADADLISDGTLLEIKTTINPRIDGAWIRQLLGYLLLDTHGEFAISSIGLYLARQGRLLTWPLPEALEILTGRPDVDLVATRTEFADFLESSLSLDKIISLAP